MHFTLNLSLPGSCHVEMSLDWDAVVFSIIMQRKK